MFSGNIETKTNQTLNNVQATLENEGFKTNRDQKRLIVVLSELKDFLFQTKLGKVFWKELVLEDNGTSMHYVFVYRMDLQVLLHVIVTVGLYFILAGNTYAQGDPNLLVLT